MYFYTLIFHKTLNMSSLDKFDQQWVHEGCLPPDEGEEMLKKLEADGEAGKLNDSVRNRVAANALYVFSQNEIDKATYARVLAALKVDTDGNLL
jgi:hypothetical protein